MRAEDSKDPWTDARPLAERVAEREARYARVTLALETMLQEERDLARAAAQRFASGELSLGEVYVEYERWEQHAAVLATYPADDPRRDGGIRYADARMDQLARQGNRMLSATQRPMGKRHLRFEEPDFRSARLADLVGLAETLGYALRKRGRTWVMSCPWHGADTDPSLTIFEPGLGWHCFGCGRGGQDAASFAAEHFGCSQAEGLRWLKELADGA